MPHIIEELRGQNVLVIGAGLSGRAAATFLAQNAVKTILTDDKPAAELSGLDELLSAGVGLALGGMPQDVSEFALAVISPGIPLTIPIVGRLAAAGVPLIGELELAWRCSANPWLAITGTNGKTTTTSLLGYIIREAGRECLVGGNIGAALCSEVGRLGPEGCIVAELSSFQLETAVDFHAHIAAYLNLTPDHLYRHQTMENYGAIKAKIFAHQSADDLAVLNYDDPLVRAYADSIEGTVIYFSRRERLDERFDSAMYVEDGRMIWLWQGEKRPVIDTADIRIKGPHNLENALAAAAMAALLGVEIADIARALASFAGVEHRQEPVGEFGGVLYINDSKGTNPDSTLMALAACTRPTVLILGGYDKGSDFAPLLPLIREHVHHIVLVGETAGQIAETLQAGGFTSYTHAGRDFAECVRLAAAAARPGDQVLLSPACASWDMFNSFEERGRVFKELVAEIAAKD